MILEKKHRLALSCYEGYTRASFTVCIKNRKHVFTNSCVVENFTAVFASSTIKSICASIGFTCLCLPEVHRKERDLKEHIFYLGKRL